MRNGPSSLESWGRHSNAPSQGTMTGASINTPSYFPFLHALEGRATLRWRANYLVFEGHTFGIVLLEPGCRDVGGSEDLVLEVTNLLAGVDVDKDHHEKESWAGPSPADPLAHLCARRRQYDDADLAWLTLGATFLA